MEMEQTEQVLENQNNEVATTPENMESEVKQFEYAKLLMTCACGHTEALQDHVQGGIRILLPATDKHKFVVGCPKCNANISLHWEESTAPEVKEEVLAEEVSLPTEPNSQLDVKGDIEGTPESEVDNAIEFIPEATDISEKEGRVVEFNK